MTGASSVLLTGGSRVGAVAWAVAVGNLVIIVVYDLATLFPPVGATGWPGLIASLVTAAAAGAAAGWLVIALRGGVFGLALLALLVILEAAVSAQGLSGVGRGYATWLADDLPRSAWGVRWAGLVSAVALGLVGRLRMDSQRRRMETTTNGPSVQGTPTG